MVAHLLLLGVAQDAGVPQTGCTCTNCSAVWAGTLPRQFAVSAALIDPGSKQYWLIDCTPDFKDQYHMLLQWLGTYGRECLSLKWCDSGLPPSASTAADAPSRLHYCSLSSITPAACVVPLPACCLSACFFTWPATTITTTQRLLVCRTAS